MGVSSVGRYVERLHKDCSRVSIKDMTYADFKRMKLRFKDLLHYYRRSGCSVCGYNNYIGALHAHHKDGYEKKFSLGDIQTARFLCKNRKRIGNRWVVDQEELFYLFQEEAKKCVILCSNCHKEIHAKKDMDEFSE